MLRALAPIACAALLAAGAAAAASPPMPGEIAPDPIGSGPEGRVLRVSDFRGRVLVLSFWASWCAPCLRELELLERLQQAAGAAQVAVVGVNWQDSAAGYDTVLARLRGLPLALTRDADGSVGERYAVRRIPRLFIVDQDGRIAYAHTGYAPERSIAAIAGEVETLLRHPPAAVGGAPLS